MSFGILADIRMADDPGGVEATHIPGQDVTRPNDVTRISAAIFESAASPAGQLRVRGETRIYRQESGLAASVNIFLRLPLNEFLWIAGRSRNEKLSMSRSGITSAFNFIPSLVQV